MSIFFYIFISFMILSPSLFAESTYLVTVKKVENKRSRGWDLMSWLATKKKMALMDQWLAMNSSSNNFEFYVGYSKGDYTLTHQYNFTENKIKIDDDFYQAGFFFKILGIEGSYQKSNEDHTMQKINFSLRILGTSAQTTNITAQYGYAKFKKLEEVFSTNFAGGSATLYLLSFLGGNCQYHQYLGDSLTGREMKYGAFIDIWFLRAYIEWFNEKLKWVSELGDLNQIRDGYRIGGTIFF